MPIEIVGQNRAAAVRVADEQRIATALAHGLHCGSHQTVRDVCQGFSRCGVELTRGRENPLQIRGPRERRTTPTIAAAAPSLFRVRGDRDGKSGGRALIRRGRWCLPVLPRAPAAARSWDPIDAPPQSGRGKDTLPHAAIDAPGLEVISTPHVARPVLIMVFLQGSERRVPPCADRSRGFRPSAW